MSIVGLELIIADITIKIAPTATLIFVGEISDLMLLEASRPAALRFHHWIVIKRSKIKINGTTSLPNQHFGAVIYTRYDSPLIHVPTRIPHSICPSCDNTSRDYGGKTQNTSSFGPLISDVWKDISCDLEGDIIPVIQRFSSFFAIKQYSELLYLDCRSVKVTRESPPLREHNPNVQELPKKFLNKIVDGDASEVLAKLPDNSIDFVFCDPPYNLKKSYLGCRDDLDTKDYFAWCDRWLQQLARVLKPGHTCAVLNLPHLVVRHFVSLQSNLRFQNWIAWDALAFPVRKIMPAHYSVLCLSKGTPRDLPGVQLQTANVVPTAPQQFRPFEALSDAYCIRPPCIATRARCGNPGYSPVTDLWTDIHRVRHNNRRVDHPCQMPPHFLYRLLMLFTHERECILDCFNGAGTTTLAAHQVNRKFIGIDASKTYCKITRKRHNEIERGLDPFRKMNRVPKVKNSPGPRIPVRQYKVPKKELQLDVRRVASILGRIPDAAEVGKLGKYALKYYTTYFPTWSQACAAARAAGFKKQTM